MRRGEAMYGSDRQTEREKNEREGSETRSDEWRTVKISESNDESRPLRSASEWHNYLKLKAKNKRQRTENTGEQR